MEDRCARTIDEPSFFSRSSLFFVLDGYSLKKAGKRRDLFPAHGGVDRDGQYLQADEQLPKRFRQSRRPFSTHWMNFLSQDSTQSFRLRPMFLFSMENPSLSVY
jgi:hypothetical protein